MKSYTDIEQSKRLSEIIPIESADMYYPNSTVVKYQGALPIEFKHGNPLLSQEIAAWSLAALLDVLRICTIPTAFSTNISVPSLTKTKNGYSITYIGDYRIMESNNNDIESPIEIVADNPVDACFKMIIKLKEMNLI